MATLRHLETGIEVPLAARHVVGRSRTCQLQLQLADISALHAEFTWNGRVWHLRDLASRNGTFVAGERIPPGQLVALVPGIEIGFGAAPGHYIFAESSAPRLLAFGSGEILVADDDVLCLPSRTESEAIIFRDANERWMIETRDGTRPVGDEERVVVSQQQYSIHLPGEVLATSDAKHAPGLPPEEGLFEFLVSRDGEHVDLLIRQGDHVHSIESRAHVQLLLVLARTRAADAKRAELLEREQGWMHREDVMSELGLADLQLLNLWVFRARQQFAQLKLAGASNVIERRERTGQLRLGVRRVRIMDA